MNVAVNWAMNRSNPTMANRVVKAFIVIVLFIQITRSTIVTVPRVIEILAKTAVKRALN